MKSDTFNYNWLENAESSAQCLVKELQKPLSYHPNQFVHRAGDIADGLYYIERGTIRINKLSNEGKELLVIDLVQGEWFGFIGCFGSGIRPNDAVALDTAKLLHLSKRNLDRVIKQYPSISLNVAHLLASYVEYYGSVYEHSVFMSLNSRLRATLQQLCKWKGTAELDISQNELAAMLGVTKEAIGINLNILKSQGVVNIGYRKIEYIG